MSRKIVAKKRNVVGLGDRFAKYAKRVCIRINVPELKKDTTHRGRELLKLLNSKIDGFSSHIKYCESFVDGLTFDEKAFMARVALVGGNSFFYQLSSVSEDNK